MFNLLPLCYNMSAAALITSKVLTFFFPTDLCYQKGPIKCGCTSLLVIGCLSMTPRKRHHGHLVRFREWCRVFMFLCVLPFVDQNLREHTTPTCLRGNAWPKRSTYRKPEYRSVIYFRVSLLYTVFSRIDIIVFQQSFCHTNAMHASAFWSGLVGTVNNEVNFMSLLPWQ